MTMTGKRETGALAGARTPGKAIAGLAAGFALAVLGSLYLAGPYDAEGKLPKVGAELTFPSAPLDQPMLQQELAKGELRIFVVGASLCYGLPYQPAGRASFATLLEKGLRGVLGREDIHVRPEAQPAWDSAQVVQHAEMLLPWQPKALIVVLGSNEFVNRVPLGRSLFPDGWTGSIELLFRRCGKLYGDWYADLDRKMFGASKESKKPKTGELYQGAGPGRPAVKGLPVGERDRAYFVARLEDNMRRCASFCAEAGTSLYFAFSVQGMLGSPPWLSLPYDRKISDFVAQLEEAPDPAELARLEALLADSPKRADLHFAKALLLRASGEKSTAAKEFRLALDLDLAPLHHVSEVVTHMRRIAKELEVPLLDFNEVLADEAGITGARYFLDYSHVDLDGHLRIALHLAKELSGTVLPELPEGFEKQFEAAARRHIATSIDPHSIHTALPRMAFNDAVYYMFFGNFHAALPRLILANEALGEDRIERALEYCRKQLGAGQ